MVICRVSSISPFVAGWLFFAPFCSAGFWLIVVFFRRVKPIITYLFHTMLGAKRDITRCSVQLTRKLCCSTNAATLPGNLRPYFTIVAKHLDFPTFRACLCRQSHNDTISGLSVVGKDDTNPAVVTGLLARTVAIEDDDHLVRCMTIASHQMVNQLFASGGKVFDLDCMQRGIVFNHIIAINQNFVPHSRFLQRLPPKLSY